MDYFLGPAPSLPDFLHELLRAEGEDVLARGAMRICTFRERLFFTRMDRVAVAGPFSSLRQLVETMGVQIRGQAPTPDVGPRCYRVWDWVFEVDGEGVRALTDSAS